MSPDKTERVQGRCNEKSKWGSINGLRYKTCVRERIKCVMRCWHCGEEGHIERFGT